MIALEPVEVKRDRHGMWMHPAFKWNEVPEDGDIRPCFKEWGYECGFRSLEDDAPDEIVTRYFDSNDPDCSYWTPTPPKGGGWSLGAIYDTEDGPMSLWLRPLSPNTKLTHD